MGACGTEAYLESSRHPFSSGKKLGAGLLISYFDANRKALDYQSKNPCSTLVRVANLTRKARLIQSLRKRLRKRHFSSFREPLGATRADASSGLRDEAGSYNEPSMQACV